ncbi:hypothetical protein PENANT_c195G01403 [Penicillium antarcticum]|uniref:protein acetyllysine N-acetyltransferase n=1 Tax=Penicillium antarcticum TaxID=416450 RepID=A0A1V6PAC9_9EURO|nr:hypothetical protein PENANT_c195G01403 [Penicillium antarcticum]
MVFTGAGVSTHPDFRGPDGNWTLRAQGKPRTKHANTLQAIPSPSHMALVELQNRGILNQFISQNCVGLHRRSGNLPKPIFPHSTRAILDTSGHCILFTIHFETWNKGGSPVRTSSIQELLQTMPNQEVAPLSKSSGKTISADAYEATRSSMHWEGRHGATDVTEQFTDPSSYITTSDDDVLNDGAYMTWMSETESPSARYIMGLTEDSSRASKLPQLQLPAAELKPYSPDSFLNEVGEPSDGYYHGQTVAKITAPISAKVTEAETTSRGHSATPSGGSLRQALSLSRTFQAFTESEYVLESLEWSVSHTVFHHGSFYELFITCHFNYIG